MKLIPIPLINQQVTKDLMDWHTRQPHIITIDKDKVDQEFLDKISMVTTVSNDVIIEPSEFIIDERTKEFMLFELQKILEFNGFKSELLNNGSLQVSKERWSMEIENILQQMPFADYLPHQINRAYEHYKQKLNESLLECRREDEKEYDRLVHGNDHLYPYEAGWTMASKEVHAEQQRELNRSHGEDGYPSRERLESIRQTIIDNTEGEL